MKSRINNKKTNQNSTVRGRDAARHVSTLLAIAILATMSCNRIYDNVEKYVDGETVYIDKLDGIIRVQIGYERVEIDLLKAGRIPSSQIRTARATKTVIECPDFTEPGNRRVIDSVCSWVNITGLTQLKTYKFTIYTEDDNGDRSMPLIAEARPYTAENLKAIEIIPPKIVESTSSALIEWPEVLSAHTYKMYRYTWQYKDRNNTVQTGGGKGDMPRFFVENVDKAKDIPISLVCRIIPTISNSNGTYTPIIDSVDWKTTLNLRISGNADPVIFLKTPSSFLAIDFDDADDVFPLTFSWVKTDEANGYMLKFSTDPLFPAGNTYTIDVGDVGEYVMSDVNTLKNRFTNRRDREFRLYWTITPTTPDLPVKTQSLFAVIKPVSLEKRVSAIGGCAGLWEFEDANNLMKPTIGKNLITHQRLNTTDIGVPSTGGRSQVAGFNSVDRAMRFNAQAYILLCDHGIPPTSGSDQVTEWTMLFDFNISNAWTSLLQTSVTVLDNHELEFNGGINGSNVSIGGGIIPTVYVPMYRIWGTLAVTVKYPDFVRIYGNGALIVERINPPASSRLDPAGFILFYYVGNNSGRNVDISSFAVFNRALTHEEVSSLGGL